jgi:hypothetical protein
MIARYQFFSKVREMGVNFKKRLATLSAALRQGFSTAHTPARGRSLPNQPGWRIKLSAGMPKPVCSFHTMAMVSLRLPLSTS